MLVFANAHSGNRLRRAVDGSGASVRYELDALGRARSVTDPNGLVRRYTYYGPEQNGRLKSTSDPLGHTTSYEYDRLGRLTRRIDALGRDAYTFYDAAQRPVREVGPVVIDPSFASVRPVTLRRYDLLGALVEVRYGRTDAANPANAGADVTTLQASYQLDDFGRLLSETDAGGRRWQYAYDRYGNRTRSTSPRGQTSTWTYGYGGRLPSERLDADGRRTTYAWNPLGALTRLASLDAAGNPVLAYDYTYDEAQRLVRVSDSRAGQWLDWQWSPGGQLNRLTDADGRVTAYQYGPSGQLTSLWSPDGEQLSFAYDAGGRLLERRFGNGAGSRFSWNADGTLARRQNLASATTLVSQHDYAYDGLGRLSEARNGVRARESFDPRPSTPCAAAQ